MNVLNMTLSKPSGSDMKLSKYNARLNWPCTKSRNESYSRRENLKLKVEDEDLKKAIDTFCTSTNS